MSCRGLQQVAATVIVMLSSCARTTLSECAALIQAAVLGAGLRALPDSFKIRTNSVPSLGTQEY